VVANPAAAGITRELVSEVTARADAAAARVDVLWTRERGEAAAVAAQSTRWASADMIVVLGGDGTASEVAAGILSVEGPRQIPSILVLPAGSGNSTSINLWGDGNCSDVLEIVLAGPVWGRWSVDTLQIAEPEVSCILGASTGLLAQALIEARFVSGKRGRDRYMDAAATVLAEPPSHPTRVTVDGAVLCETALTVVSVGGGRRRVSAFEFLPLSELDDGLLDVCAISASTPELAGRIAQRLLDGSHLGIPGVYYAQGRQVVIERCDGLPLVSEYDGEVLPPGPHRLTVDVVPAALDLVVPPVGPWPASV
jgi:diacylglycerol kinase (ATP)